MYLTVDHYLHEIYAWNKVGERNAYFCAVCCNNAAKQTTVGVEELYAL